METQIDIRDNYYNGNLEIWIFEFNSAHQYNLTTDEKGMITRTEMPEMINYKEGAFHPFLSLPRRLGILVLKDLYEWHEKHGTKTVNQNFTEGKLQATEKHLEDYQKIVTKLLKL